MCLKRKAVSSDWTSVGDRELDDLACFELGELFLVFAVESGEMTIRATWTAESLRRTAPTSRPRSAPSRLPAKRPMRRSTTPRTDARPRHDGATKQGDGQPWTSPIQIQGENPLR